MTVSPDTLVFKGPVKDAESVVNFLFQQTGISKNKIKDAMGKGALWWRREGNGLRRLRRAQTTLRDGDWLEFYYDKSILEKNPPPPVLVADKKVYGIWFKPPGLLSQGTKFGDHFSLPRQVELFFHLQRMVYTVHRLDRETAGLAIIAHTKKTAAAFSRMFQAGLVLKEYRAVVSGNTAIHRSQGIIDIPLEGKKAFTSYETVSHNLEANTTTLLVKTSTGRLHQIRRHLALIGHPVIGDPRYGRGNKNEEGLMLKAVRLRFPCPTSDSVLNFTLPAEIDGTTDIDITIGQ